MSLAEGISGDYMKEPPAPGATNGAAPKPLRGAAGRPLTQEQKDKMAEGRRRSAKNKKALRESGRERVARSAQPRPRSLPANLPGGITAAVRRKIIGMVRQVIQAAEGTGMFVAARTPAPIPTRRDADGALVLAVSEAEAQRIATEHYRRFEADRLEPWELDYLAEAFTDEALRYPRLRTWLVRAVDWKDRSSLPMALMVVALPRLHRHGAIPDEFGDLVSALRDAARSARGADRGHRNGQDDARGGGVPDPAGDPAEVRPSSSL